MSGEKELEAELVAVENNIKGIERAIEKLSDKKQKLLSRKQQIRQRIQEYASEKLAGQDWERCDHPWSAKVDKTLKCVFKMNTFRPHQLSTINAVMSQQDCILLMPTGGGKSLCYQLPAMVLPGITLVVSPLVSLMEDQIMAMEALKVPAALLNASSTREHVNYVQRQMTEKDPSLKLLYVTPEKLAKSKRFMSKLEKMYKMGQFSLLAIDEVHCCSQWGHDFRPDYKFLGIMKRQFPNVPILGLTATATSSVIADLQNILNIQGCLVLKASFNRPNLKYEVVCKSSCQKDNVDELEKMLKNRFNGLTGIIYCFSIKDSEDIAAELRKRSIRSRAYHAQLDAKSRSAVHHSWSSNEIQVIVATVAFGMGIDKPDVRFVIHHSMPKSMENFYQESGRAGRDDNPASCILFYRFPDIFRQSTMIFTEQKGLEHLYAMVSYCLNLSRCRRAVIAEHFGERWEKSDCNNMCDHCDNYSPYAEKMKNVVDCHKTLCQILEHCNRIDERLTSQKLIDTWLCKGPAKLRPPGHKSASLSRETCERIVALLLLDSYLIEEFHFTPYSTISYINIGPRNLPSNGELILPLPVLKTKLQSKHFVDSESKSSATSGKSSSKISCPSKSSPKVSCPGNSSPKVSSPGKSSPKVSRPPEKKKQKLSSEIEVRKNSQQKSSSKSNHSSPKQSNKASSSSSKDPQLCVVNKEKSFFHNVVAIETDDYKTTDKIARDQIEEPDPIEISDDDIDFGSYDELKYHKRKKNVPMVVVSDSE